MAEVIELSDSSDDEGRQVSIGKTATVSQLKQSQVISLLESDSDSDNDNCNDNDNDNDNESSEIGVVSTIASASIAPARSSASKRYASLDSDSDDSLDQYQASGLSNNILCGRISLKRKRDSSFDSTTLMFSPPATVATKKVTPNQPSINKNCSSNSRVISQEDTDEPMSASQTSDENAGSVIQEGASTARHPQTPIEPRRIITNPYTQKKKASTSASTAMIANPYARKSPPATTSASDEALLATSSLSNEHQCFPSRLTKRSKTYPDLRAKMALCLWRYARSLAHSSYHRAKFTQTIQKVVALSCMAIYPIRSLQEYILRFQAQSIEAVSLLNQKVTDLSEQLRKGGWETVSTAIHASATGQYYSIAEACLVACKKRLQPQLEADGTNSLEDQLKRKENFIPLSSILPDIDRHLRPECPSNITRPQEEDNGVNYYQQSSTISAEFHQIKRLASLSYIKFHKRKGSTLVELLPLGFQTAERLLSRMYPEPNGWYRRSHHDNHNNSSRNSNNSNSNNSNSNKYQTAPAYPNASMTLTQTPSSSSSSSSYCYNNLVMCMDFREGGGATRVLHQMCNDLDSMQLPYFVASLSIGDYVFFHKDKLLPVLIERKTVEDLAQSIYDGRWLSQKKRMYQGQHIFGHEKAILIYIVEGKQEHHLVTGGFIGSTRFKISLERLNQEIDSLATDGFDVLRTASPSSTLHELSKWAKRIDQQVQAGDLKPKYTYEEFREEVKKIPATTDFSRIAKDHYRQRKEREILAQETIVLIDSDSDDDDHKNDLPGQRNHQLAERVTAVTAAAAAPLTASVASTIRPAAVAFHTPLLAASGARRTTAASIAQEIKQRVCSTAFPKAEQQQQHLADYSKWKRDELVKECLQYGLTKSGSRKDLVERLQGPRPPTLWIQRKLAGHWVPGRPDSTGTALLVALLLLQQDHPLETEGFRKADICKKADLLNISREPFVGGKKSFGQFYDGWSACAYCKKDPFPLVETRKNYKFRLTLQGQKFAGFPLAEQLHEWCHVHNVCSCKDL